MSVIVTHFPVNNPFPIVTLEDALIWLYAPKEQLFPILMVGIAPQIFHAGSHESFPRATFLTKPMYCFAFNGETEVSVAGVP